MTGRGQMVRNRDGGSAAAGPRELPDSVPALGHSLALAREAAGLSLSEAAERAGLDTAELEELESGGGEILHNRVETLRALGAYANSLGLPGDDYVLAAVALWPTVVPAAARRADTTVVPVVSVSSAPAGGHSPAGASGAMWPGHPTGVPDAFITRVVEPVPSSPAGDTGVVPIVTTGEVQAIRLRTPTYLRVLVGLTALLVVLGGAGLIEHDHLASWVATSRTTVNHWYDNARSALGNSSSPPARSHHTATPATTPSTAARTASVTMKALPGGLAENITVDAASFNVKILAVGGPCWVEATAPGQARAVFGQTLQAGQSHLFTVTKTLTIETGSSAGRAQVYRGFQLIGHYTPTRVPFHMTFTSTG